MMVFMNVEWYRDCMLKREKGENILKSTCKSLEQMQYIIHPFSLRIKLAKTSFQNVPSHVQNKKQVINNLHIGCQALEISSAVVI